jgi:hypothetical protein
MTCSQLNGTLRDVDAFEEGSGLDLPNNFEWDVDAFEEGSGLDLRNNFEFSC